MINKKFVLNFILCAVVAVTLYGQNNTDSASIKSLKEAYAGKFLIGTAGDLRGYSDAELTNIKTQYDILTPENCMKPQPTHPSEDTYNFTTSDAMVDWCQQNGVKVWGHTLLWHAQTGRWFFQGPDGQNTSLLLLDVTKGALLVGMWLTKRSQIAVLAKRRIYVIAVGTKRSDRTF